MEKREVLKTHNHLPETVGSIVSMYRGKPYSQAEIKPEMSL